MNAPKWKYVIMTANINKYLPYIFVPMTLLFNKNITFYRNHECAKYASIISLIKFTPAVYIFIIASNGSICLFELTNYITYQHLSSFNLIHIHGIGWVKACNSFVVNTEVDSTTKTEILWNDFKLEWTYILIFVAGEIVRDTQLGWDILFQESGNSLFIWKTNIYIYVCVWLNNYGKHFSLYRYVLYIKRPYFYTCY